VLRLSSAIAIGCLVGACTTAPIEPSVALLAETSPPAFAGDVPLPSQDPCATFFIRAGAFSKRIAESAANLRSLIRADPFDAVETLSAVRHISALLGADRELPAVASLCDPTHGLAAPLADSQRLLSGPVGAGLDAGFGDPVRLRQAAKAIWELLPGLTKLASSVIQAAATTNLVLLAAEISDSASDPLGHLPVIQVAVAPTPTPTDGGGTTTGGGSTSGGTGSWPTWLRRA